MYHQLYKRKPLGFLFLFFITGTLLAQEPRLALPIGHTSRLTSVAFSPDGKKVVTASADGTAKIWNVETGTLLTELKGHKQEILTASFSPDGKKIVTASWDGTAKIWTTGGNSIADLKGHRYQLTSAAFSPDGKKVVTTSLDQTAKVWEAATGALLADLHKNAAFYADVVEKASFSTDGKKILTASRDAFAIWDAETGALLLKNKGHKGKIITAVFSPDGKKFASSSWDGAAKIWEAETGTLLTELNGHKKGIQIVSFSPDNKLLLTASDDTTARIWNAGTGDLLLTLTGHKDKLLSAAFSPDGKKVVTASADATIKIWNTDSGALLADLKNHQHWVSSVAFSPDGNKIASASWDHTSKIWNTETGALLTELKGHTNHISSAMFSPGGEKILIASETAKVWSAQTGALLLDLRGHQGRLSAAVFSPDGKKIVTASDDAIAKVWDAATGNQLINLIGHTNSLSTVSFSPDGKKIITASYDSTAKVWDAQTGAMLANLKGHKGFLYSAFFSPDGKKIVTVSWDGKARLWKADKASLVATLNLSFGSMNYVFFTPDNKEIVAASGDQYKVWNAETGAVKIESGTSEDRTLSVHYAPDGNQAVVVTDKAIEIKHPESGILSNKITIEKGFAVNDIDFGSKRLIALRNSELGLFDLQSGKKISTMIAIDSAESFLQIESKHYHSTPGASKLLHYVTPDLKVITFEQLDVKYNRPDLVLRTLGYKDSILIQSYKKAYEKRIRRLGLDTTAFTAVLNVPEADFAERDSIAYTHKKDRLQLRIMAKDSAYFLDRFNVWVNEAPLFGIRGVSLKRWRTNILDTILTIPLSQGINVIETSVTNTNGTESYRMPLQVNYQPSQPQKEKLYFIGIGIDQFQDSAQNLSYSVKDIRDLTLKLKEKYGSNIIIDTLFNEKVNVSAIAALKKRLYSTTVNDKVILAYSGHGLLSHDYDYYLSTYNVDFKKPETGGLPYEMLESLLDSIPARKKLMLIDACHSGEVDKEEMQKYRAVIKEKASVGLKGLDIENTDTSAHRGMQNSFELMQQLFVDVSRSTGATVISAAAGTQLAQERGELKNGVFTFAILEYMKENPSATVSELKNYVNKRVTELTDGLQVPTTRSETKMIQWKVW